MIITWKCKKCGDIVESDSKKRHDMDFCKCRESAMDLEEYYSREMGEIEIISRTNDEEVH